MSTYRRAMFLGLVVTAIAVQACGNDAQGPRPGGAPQLSSVSGIPSTEAAMRQRLGETTRLVALALGSPAVRAELKAALDASPYREHKLHFSRFVRGAGRGLLAGMAAGKKRATEAEVLAGLDSLIDAELYIPVPDHRTRWKGGADLIVASALKDHEIPVAFDLAGNPVTLTSATVPPNTPTLALVPAETRFADGLNAADAAMLECGGTCDPGDNGSGAGTVGGGTGSGGSLSLSADVQAIGGVVMTFADIPGSYEGFLMGNPEFEVHAMAVGSDNALHDVQCAGEHAATATDQAGVKSSAYVYDQNGETWGGSVTLLSKAQALTVQANGNAVLYWIWEDDNTECKIVKGSSDVATILRGLPAALQHGYNAIKAAFRSDSAKSDSLKGANLIRELSGILAAFQNDDVVGFLVDQAEVGMHWTDANYAIVLKNPDTGQLEVRGRAKLVPITP